MIDQINEVLLEEDFSSRSEFFRVLIRMWFENMKDRPCEEMKEQSEEVNKYEFGIPPEEMKKIKAKAKLLN